MGHDKTKPVVASLSSAPASGWYPAFEGQASHPLWLDVASIKGQEGQLPARTGIVVIGSGLSGASAAYWLSQMGLGEVTMVDWRGDDAATNRNCGHVLYGTVESAQALHAIKGPKVAEGVLKLSVELCHQLRDTASLLGVDCDYRQDGYLVMAVEEAEMAEISTSARILNDLGIHNSILSAEQLTKLGYRGVLGGRLESGGARAHPVKFRNALVEASVAAGVAYHSRVRVLSVSEEGGDVVVRYDRGDGEVGTLLADAAVVAANAYSPLLHSFFQERRLVEPFRGQIIASAPMDLSSLGHLGAQSFDHGYEYAVTTPDSRLVIGGWRNHTASGEVGTYDLGVNAEVEAGLKDFVARHYALRNSPEWTHSWSGIMAASKTGFPFIGPTTSPRIFALAGYTGHGFSWAHGSAKILAEVMAGSSNLAPELLALFNPMA